MKLLDRVDPFAFSLFSLGLSCFALGFAVAHAISRWWLK